MKDLDVVIFTGTWAYYVHCFEHLVYLLRGLTAIDDEAQVVEVAPPVNNLERSPGGRLAKRPHSFDPWSGMKRVPKYLTHVQY